MSDTEQVKIPKARTAVLSAEQLEELAIALSFVKTDAGDYFISPETGAPVHKSQALAHSEQIFGTTTGHPRALETPEHKRRREYIEGQYVKPKEEEA